MCGITGFVVNRPRENRLEVLGRMTAALRHRGPDDEGAYIDDHVALGVRRLAVIDPAGGRQPIANEDGTIHVVLNGEIYNFAALRARLERRGHRFRTRSDAEVIVHAYEESGAECVHDLDGMFAFALWDGTRQSLLLARDRMGEKPLYYHAGPDVFVFGSELRALLQHPDVPATLSLESVARYLLFECVPAPHSILSDIAKLPSGHTLVVSMADKPRLARYWDLRFRPDHSLGEPEWREQLRAQIEASVRSRLVSDVPLGVFLSGGVDSGTIAAIATRASRPGPLRTFTVGFEEPTYDERPFARQIAEHCGTEHHSIVFSPGDALGLMDDVGGLLDEPLGDASFLPRYALARAARGTATVVLSGDGGDELFCGYPTFPADRPARWLRRLLPPAIQRAARTIVEQLPHSPHYGSVDFLLKQFVRGLPYEPAVRTQLLLGGLTPSEQAGLLSPAVQRSLDAFDPYAELTRAIEDTSLRDPMERVIYQHCRFYLADQTLVATDRSTMAAGLEVRAPFLDPALVELAGRIPTRFKLRAGVVTKYLLKRTIDDLLPSPIVNRRKQGLGVPIAAWLRGPLRNVLWQRLAPDRIARRGLFEPAAIAQLIGEHLSGRANHRKILWSLLMLDAWCDHYLPDERWT
jgi:asparagine synthase (glutamine-hydrolysing)